MAAKGMRQGYVAKETGRERKEANKGKEIG